MNVSKLEAEGELAADFLEGLLDIADLDGDIDMGVEGGRASVSIVGGELGHLVGRNGAALDALQELTRLAVYRETGERSGLMLDVAGFRKGRREELVKVAEAAIERIKAGEETVVLEPMSAFERKVVHAAVAEGGLKSESEGAGGGRHVVVTPV